MTRKKKPLPIWKDNPSEVQRNAKYWIRTKGRAVAYAADEKQFAELLALRDLIDEQIPKCVLALRKAEVTWATIGAALGTTGQAASNKWAYLSPAVGDRSQTLGAVSPK